MTLLGTWTVDSSDRNAFSILGEVYMEFREDGSLIYTIVDGSKHQIIKLQYKIDGDSVITDQPSAPREERSLFSISNTGVLTLNFNGVSCRFVRQKRR